MTETIEQAPIIDNPPKNFADEARKIYVGKVMRYKTDTTLQAASLAIDFLEKDPEELDRLKGHLLRDESQISQVVKTAHRMHTKHEVKEINGDPEDFRDKAKDLINIVYSNAATYRRVLPREQIESILTYNPPGEREEREKATLTYARNLVNEARMEKIRNLETKINPTNVPRT